jgi:hypothetical protein
MRVCPKSKNLAFLVDVFPQTIYHEGFFYAEKMNTQEEWKAIAECNGQYYVSSYGRVKSYKCGRERILQPVLKGRKKHQYLSVSIAYLTGAKVKKIHRLVAIYFIDNPQNKPQVNHKDGNKLNNHINNLEWNTSQENNRHAWDIGLCESTRLAIINAKSKPVIDNITGTIYSSLKLACESIGENYYKHTSRIFHKRKNQRFFYIDDNGNG